MPFGDYPCSARADLGLGMWDISLVLELARRFGWDPGAIPALMRAHYMMVNKDSRMKSRKPRGVWEIFALGRTLLADYQG